MTVNKTRNVVYLDAPATYDSGTTPLVPKGVLGRLVAVLLDSAAASSTLTLYSGQDSTVVAKTICSLHSPANDSRQLVISVEGESGVLHFDNGLSAILTGASSVAFVFLG